MAAESLKEYLVKLGWSVDESGFSNAINKMGNFERKSGGVASKISSNFIVAGAAVFSFISTTTLAIGKLLSATAEADLATERFSRKMWTSEENARSFLSALDAMDAEFNDIFYMTPEEYSRFMALKDLGNSIQAPEGLQGTLKSVRDIGHEFDKLKVIGNYSTQWVSFYLGKYLGKDLIKIKEMFSNFNDWLVSKIPSMTEKVARFLSMIFRLGKSAAEGITRLGAAITGLWGGLSDGAKSTAGAVVAFMALLKLGPTGVFISAITMLLILLDDFLTWERKGKSAFSSMWERAIKLFNSFDKNALNELGDSVDDLLSSVWDLLKTVVELGIEFSTFLDEIGFFQAAIKIFNGGIQTTADILQAISDLLKIISGDFKKIKPDGFIGKSMFKDEAGEVDKTKTSISLGAKFAALGSIFGGLTGGVNPSLYGDLAGIFAGKPGATMPSPIISSFGGAGRGSGQPSVVNAGGAGRSVTQNNNITVVAAPGESPSTTADAVAGRVARQRDWLTSFNR